MSKPVKEMIAADLRRRYNDVDSACVVDITGLNVQQTEQIRRRLRERSARLEVVKNSLARRAFSDTALAPLGEALDGPCAVVTSQESIIDVAKVLVAAAKEFDRLTLKEAIIEGDRDLVSVTRASAMKGRRELVGELMGLITAPARALAGCLASPQARIAGCLKAMADNEE